MEQPGQRWRSGLTPSPGWIPGTSWQDETGLDAGDWQDASRTDFTGIDAAGDPLVKKLSRVEQLDAVVGCQSSRQPVQIQT